MVWMRVVIDAVHINNTEALVIDWKTGKRKPNFDQLDLTAAILFLLYPQLQTITAAFIWVEHKTQDRQTYKRDDYRNLWEKLLPRVKQFETMVGSKDFPARPSGLCKKHCVVVECEHHGDTAS